EVSHAQASRVPDQYVRRQTLTGTERYVTPELKDYEAKVLGAEERRRRLEHELFEEVRGRVAARAAPLLVTARALALLDVTAPRASACWTACSRAWARRTISRAASRPSSWRWSRRRRSSTTSRRGVSCCSTRSAAAPPPSTAWPSRGRWWRTCTIAFPAPRCS